MFPNSLRWRLPLTYAGLALLTALLLNAILLTTLLLYYQSQEQAYLFRSGLSSSADLATLLAEGADEAALAARLQQLAAQHDVRLQVLDPEGQALGDSGGPAGLLALPAPDALFVEAAYGFGRFRRTEAAAEITLRIPTSTRPVGWLRVSEGPAYGRDIVASVGRIGSLASVAAVLLAAAAGWLMSRRIVAPLVALTAVSTRMAHGDLGARASLERSDEIGVLGEAFNRMAGQVEGTVEALRHFTADAAHELHTPLTALATDLELASSEPDPQRARVYVERARLQTARLGQLSSDLLDLSRLEAGQAGEHGDVDLSALLSELAERYASRAEQAGLDFDFEAPEGVRLRGSPGQLQRAVTNVLDNALKFTPAGGRVALTLLVDADAARVSVHDTGTGIAPEDLPRLFERFQRVRNAAGFAGSGLGLAIVQAIMEQHGGHARVASAPGATTFELSWPRLPSGRTD